MASLDPEYLAQQKTGLGNELEQCHVELKRMAQQVLCLAEEEGEVHHRHHYHQQYSHQYHQLSILECHINDDEKPSV